MHPSISHFAVTTLRKRIRALVKELHGARESHDIELVHRMRVATRRLNVALNIFQPLFAEKQFKKWHDELKTLRKALADARDCDVQIEFLERYIKTIEQRKIALGVDRLFLRKKQRRAKLQSTVDEAMTHFAKSNFLKSLRGKLQDLEDQLITQQLSEEPTPELLALAEVHIAERTAELFALEPSLSDETQILRHHELRIAAKHLRYSFEIFAPLFPDKLDAKIETCKAIQEQLGTIHDLDLWLESLPKFVEKERARTIKFFGFAKPFESTLPGMEQLEKFCQHERAKFFQMFVNEWPQLKAAIEPTPPAEVRLTVSIHHAANQHHLQ